MSVRQPRAEALGRTGELDRFAAIHLLHASNRFACALIAASIVVGYALLLSAHAGPH